DSEQSPGAGRCEVDLDTALAALVLRDREPIAESRRETAVVARGRIASHRDADRASELDDQHQVRLGKLAPAARAGPSFVVADEAAGEAPQGGARLPGCGLEKSALHGADRVDHRDSSTSFTTRVAIGGCSSAPIQRNSIPPCV